MYQQELGRFMSRDPLLEGGVELLHPVPDMRQSTAEGTYEHPYAYVRNNPMNAVDPTGLVTVEILPLRPREDCTDAQKKKAEEAVKNACKRLETGDKRCLDKKLHECMEEVCKGTIYVFCVAQCDGPYCGTVMHADKKLKGKKGKPDPKLIQSLKFETLCESTVPEGRVPLLNLCWNATHGGGLGNPSKCHSNPQSAEVIPFHEMLHLCGSGVHGKESDITWHCQKACYPKSTIGKAEKCKCDPPSC